MSKKRLKSSLGFVSIGNDLVYWAQHKDLKYHSVEKAARGISSYRHALQDLSAYFNQIKVGQLRPEQKSISYFSKSWGWDWRKTLRFIVYCMSSLKNLDAGFYLQKLQSLAHKQAQKVKSYVYKKRGKELEPQPEKSEDDEIEKAFLDAIQQLATSNPEAYRAKIKANLIKGHKETLENFQQFKEQYLAQKRTRELELKAKDFDYVAALKKYHLGNGSYPGKAVDKGDYYEVWKQGQEHSIMHTDIVTKQELLLEG